ncbi:MAG: nucleotidyltransferase family protein [Phycisphaerales bacterium]
MLPHGLTIPAARLADVCQRYGVSRLALFGSVLRPDFPPDSDVDILVEFRPGSRAGLFAFAGLEMELSELLGRAVHLHTPPMLGPWYRDQVLREAQVQYAA